MAESAKLKIWSRRSTAAVDCVLLHEPIGLPLTDAAVEQKLTRASRGHQSEVLCGLERLGFAHVVVKLGAEGAAIHSGVGMIHVPSPQVKVVDTTGAGDAFDAGLIDAVLDGVDAVEMLRRATACGALSTRKPGGLMGLPVRKDLEGIYEQS